MMDIKLKTVAILGVFAGSVLGVNNGLARTPQMGWVSELPVTRER